MATVEELFAEDLARSGLVPDDVPGWDIFDQQQAARLSGQKRAGYWIPYYGLDGRPVKLSSGYDLGRIRFLEFPAGRDNRYWSFDQSSDQQHGHHCYIPARFKEVFLACKQAVVAITEGEKKAEKACKSGIPCIAIPGVDMWHDHVEHDNRVRQRMAAGGHTEVDAKEKIKESRKVPIAPEIVEVLRWCIKQRARTVVVILFDGDGASFGKELVKKLGSEKTQVIIKKGGKEIEAAENWTHPDSEETHVVINRQVRRAGWFFGECLRRQLYGYTGVKTPVQVLFCPLQEDTDKDTVTVSPLSLDDWIIKNSGPMVLSTITGALRKARMISNLARDYPIFGCSLDPDLIPDDYKGSSSKLSTESIIERLIDGENVGIAPDVPDELFEWTGSYWRVIPSNEVSIAVQAALSRLLPAKNTANTVSSCVRNVNKTEFAYRMPKVDPTLVFFEKVLIVLRDAVIEVGANGYIHIRKPRREDGFRHCINVSILDIQKPTPLFDKFLSEVLPDPDVRDTVLEFIGYTLFPDTRYEVGQLWLGSGRNGKSTLASIVESLHSHVISLKLDDMHGFGSEQLISASLVSIDEMPTRIDEHTLKEAISGQPMHINRKFKPALTIRPFAKFLMRGNEPPRISDQSDGFWRKVDVVFFKAQFEKGQRDPLLGKKIIKDELGGIVGKLLLYISNLITRGDFRELPNEMVESKAQIRRETNSVRAWANEIELVIENRQELMPQSQTVYDMYYAWCRSSGYSPMSKGTFWRHVSGIDGLRDVKNTIRMRYAGKKPYLANVQGKSAPIITMTEELDAKQQLQQSSPNGIFRVK